MFKLFRTCLLILFIISAATVAYSESTWISKKSDKSKKVEKIEKVENSEWIKKKKAKEKKKKVKENKNKLKEKIKESKSWITKKSKEKLQFPIYCRIWSNPYVCHNHYCYAYYPEFYSSTGERAYSSSH